MTPSDEHGGRPPGAADVDQLRERLRSLGYLDAGVDRFVLGPAREARQPLAIAALASLRIGLLAAVLLGPAAAVGIGTRLPGLVNGSRDAIVVALYLATLFGIAGTIASFAAGVLMARLPVDAFARRPRLVSRVAGAIVGTGCLFYLTLWWRIANTGAAAVSSPWTAFVVGIAVAISLLLGHAVTIAAFAVLAARYGQGNRTLERRRSAWRLTAAAAVLAFAGASALLLIAAPAASRDLPAPNLAVVSPGARVKLIAIDGFDPAVMESLASSGRLPNLSALFGTRAVRLSAETVRDPARDWTTVATGQPPDVHGVHGLETRRVAGLTGSVTSSENDGLASTLRGVTDLLRLTRPSTASGTELRSKPIWEVAADAGLRAAVVNWWATWPATSTAASAPLVVSDRATLRLEHGGALDGEISPPGAYERLRAEWPAIRAEAARQAGTLPMTGDEESQALLRRAAELDATQIAIASRLAAPPLDLLAIYLPGLDIAQYGLLGSGQASSPSALSLRLDALRGYYVYLDTLLRDLAAPAPGELVVVIAQPGRVVTVTHGLMAARGAGAAPTPGVVDARAVDVAPTVLHALGIPISRELAGGPMLGLFGADFAQRFPIRHVKTYGRRTGTGGLREGQPLDREMIERLRSLGYVR